MPRMKLTTLEFNPKKLDVKVEKSKFKRYTGDVPRSGTILIARVTKLWWTQSEDGTSMIKLLAVAEQNEGKYEKYNGLPIWEYLVFKPEAAFRYVPFLEVFGITLLDIKNKMIIEDEPDKIGDIITAIAGWEVGSDDALCRIVIFRRKWNNEDEARVDREGWLPLDEADEVDEDEDIDEDEDEEDEEPPARPAKRGAKASATTRSRRRAEPEPEEDEDEDEDDEDEDDIDDEAEDQEDDEDDEAEEEDEEESDEEPDEEPPARTKRGATRSARTSSRPASSSRSTRTSGSRPTTSRRGDGSRTGTRRSTAATERTPGKRGSKGRDGGSREDPPF